MSDPSPSFSGGETSSLVAIDQDTYRKAMDRVELETLASLRRVYRELEELEFIEARISSDRT